MTEDPAAGRVRLMAPNGLELRGTVETLAGVALATVERGADGKVSVEYGGATDIWWDEQRTVERDGQRVFVDVKGNEWLEGQLVPETAGADDEGEGA